MTKDEALKLALEALEYISSHYMSLPKIGCMALAAVEEALAQPEQEPVAWMDEEMTCIFFDAERPEPFDFDFWKPLYATPPQRIWVGLTDEDMADITSLPIGTCSMMLKVEAKLKEKNT